MPIYEYECGKCGHQFEREQRITEDPIRTCPACRSKKARRLISLTSFVLKGGGWYNDLYASTGGKKKDSDGGDGSGGDGSKGGAGDGGASKKEDAGKSSGKGGAGSKRSGGKKGDAKSAAA